MRGIVTNRTVTALYDDFETAQEVIEDLVSMGFQREQISIVANDASGQYASYLAPDRGSVTEDVSAVVGARVGLGVMLIPGIGPVIAGGPLVAALVGAVTGAATGGLVAGLVDMGIPETEAGYFAEAVRRGGTLVVVNTTDDWVDQVVEVMEAHNPVDINQRATEWSNQGRTGFDTNAAPYTAQGVERESREPVTPEMGAASPVRTYTAQTESGEAPDDMADFEAFRADFEDHYWTHYGEAGHDFDYYLPAYRYGYRLAHDQRYTDMDWSRLELRARLYWEEHMEGAWDDFRDAVSYAWNRVRVTVS